MDLEHFKKILLNRLQELDVRLHEIEDDLEAPVDPDMSEQAIEREEDEVLESLGNSGLAEIRKINAALSRIDDGTFGVCGKCSTQISAERLEAVPYTALCRNCAV